MSKGATKRLKNGAGHVVYEVDMLRKTTYLLYLMKDSRIRFPDQATGRTFFNSVLESYLMHLRNLYSFFYSFTYRNKRRPDDIHFSHFLMSNSVFVSKRYPQGKISRRILRRIDKSLAHLSYTRNYYSLKRGGWNVPKLTREIEQTIKAFKESLPNQKAKWFQAL